VSSPCTYERCLYLCGAFEVVLCFLLKILRGWNREEKVLDSVAGSMFGSSYLFKR